MTGAQTVTRANGDRAVAGGHHDVALDGVDDPLGIGRVGLLSGGQRNTARLDSFL